MKQKTRLHEGSRVARVVPQDNVTWNTIEAELTELYKILSTQKGYKFQQITAMV